MSDPRNPYIHRLNSAGVEGDKALAVNAIQLWDRLHATESELAATREACEKWSMINLDLENEVRRLTEALRKVRSEISTLKDSRATTSKWLGWLTR